MIDIKAIKAAAEAATPGEWVASDNGHIYSAALNLLVVAQHCRDKDSNAKHIATANPATVIALCDEVDRLRKDAARLDHVLKWDDHYWISREQIDEAIADEVAVEPRP